MALLQDIPAEQLARLFHHYQEILTNQFHDSSEGSSGDKVSTPWERTSQADRKLLVAAAQLSLMELDSAADRELDSRKYYAKPGEAEWGC
jgi:hypothetical protein